MNLRATHIFSKPLAKIHMLNFVSCILSPGLVKPGFRHASIACVVALWTVAIGLGLGLCGCAKARVPAADGSVQTGRPPIVTGDIKAGIEKHITEQTARDGGFFIVPFEGEQLKLKLVRVHVEYLASLAPRRHFACVDMVSDDGQFYDIDFFLAGDPGAMTVTETTVHKLNGRPFYVWQQIKKKIWARVPVAEAAKELLGVVSGRDTFEFRYQATLPQLTGPARCWLPLAVSNTFQHVTVTSVTVPGASKTLEEQTHGNRILLLELGPKDSGKSIEIVYDVARAETGAYLGDAHEAARHLAPERLTPENEQLKAEALKATAGKEGDLMRARALYDYVKDAMRYMKFGEGWGRGDAVRACGTHYGNCTDYHAYFISLARAVGIPARFMIGAAIPSERDDGGTDGYHCWAEFYAEGKWWPIDISEADKFSALSMYYFGHLPANRFEFTRGRDLVVEPGPTAGPINFLAYPLLEVAGETQTLPTLFLFKRTKSPQETR